MVGDTVVVVDADEESDAIHHLIGCEATVERVDLKDTVLCYLVHFTEQPLTSGPISLWMKREWVQLVREDEL